MVLGVVGGADPQEVIDLSEEHLVTANDCGTMPADPAPWKPRRGPLRVGRALPKEQSHLVIGFPGTTLGDEDRFALDVLVEILGGHGGRLFAGVRERLGLAYSVTAMSMEGIEPGYVAMYAGTSPGQEAKVVDAVLAELSAVKSRRPAGAELSRVKSHLIGTRAIASQRASARAAGTSLGHIYGLGHDVDERYPEGIRRQRSQDVVEAAAKYLDPARMIICCVGPTGARALGPC
jgi:zinc protease